MQAPLRRWAHASPALQRHPGGFVLIVVLVVVVLLSLGAYTFSEYMVIETKASAAHGRATQARALADSGVEYAAALLGDRAGLPSLGIFHNPTLFQGVTVAESERAAARGRFTIVAPVEGDPSARNIRYGLIDESSKMNVNTIATLVPTDNTPKEDPTADTAPNAAGANAGTGSSTSGTGSTPTGTSTAGTLTGLPNPLMGIPGMTQEIADAILDWVDDDTAVRDYGAESEYYQGLNPPYECKNAPLESLDELMLIRGVTEELLFGEDANRNGLLDPNENDGDLTYPPDNADGMLQRGWSAYLTVYSRELNLQYNRLPKVFVNSNTLSDVYDQLEDTMGEDIAKFVVAYRLYGPQPTAEEAGSASAQGAQRQQTGRVGNSAVVQGPTDVGDLQGQQAGAAAQAAGQALAGRAGNVTRGGMDLTNGGKFQIKSLYDLIGVNVEGQFDGATAILESPWPNDPGAMSSYLPEISEQMTAYRGDYIEGRININQAHREVLLGLPTMTEELATSIVTAQLRGPNGEPLSDVDATRSTTGWLLMQGICDLETLRQIEPYITARGDVFRMQVLGHFDSAGPVVRIEAVVDATLNPPRAVFYRDLTNLGKGYILPTLQQ